MQQLTQEILRLCREYGECRVEVERMEEARRVKNALESVCSMARQRLEISDPALLLALLDACEVTRAVSAESVKLLACCYYYVEEEECAERARRMLEELRKLGMGEEELADAETILEELT